MKKSIISFIAFFCSLFATGCENGADKYKQDVIIPNKDNIKYTADYDDGETIYINVKIAIDKKGWESKTSSFFKEQLAGQWKKINDRFNDCGQKGDVKLKRHYIFQPDLEDIFIYDGCSYWGENGADTKVIKNMDQQIFKLVVIYDFIYEGAEKNEYGGGCGDYNGIGTILVINASDEQKNKFNDHFDEYTYRAITHELGHYRGVIDLYAEVIQSDNNPVNHQGYMPISCLMNDQTYTPDELSAWSDYALKIINKSGNLKIPGMIDKYMYDDFTDHLLIECRQGDVPVNALVNFYPQTGRYQNGIDSRPKHKYILENGLKELDARPLFFNNPDYKWDRTAIYLVEASFNGVKKYQWLADYMLHDAGIEQENTYKLLFEF